MIESALRYQTQGQEWLKRVGVGALVTVLANLLFVPIFTVYGYMLEVMRRVMRGNTATPPAWDELDIVDISVEGAKAFGILFAYTTGIGLVLSFPSGVLLYLGLLLESDMLEMSGYVVGTITSLIGIGLISIVVPIAIGNFVIADSIKAGFDTATLQEMGTNSTMLRTAAVGLGVNALTGVVSGILIVTIVGTHTAAFIGLSAVSVIWASGFADAYEEIHGQRPTVTSEAKPRSKATNESRTATADDTADAPDDAGEPADDANEKDEAATETTGESANSPTDDENEKDESATETTGESANSPTDDENRGE